MKNHFTKSSFFYPSVGFGYYLQDTNLLTKKRKLQTPIYHSPNEASECCKSSSILEYCSHYGTRNRRFQMWPKRMPIDFAKNVLILHSKHRAAAAAAAATANFRALLPVPLVEKISFHLVLIKRKFPVSCFCRPSPIMRTRMAAACCRRHALLPPP